MSDGEVYRSLARVLEGAGALWRLVPVARLQELQSDLIARRESGEIDPGFSEERLSRFIFRPPEQDTQAASVLILAVRQFQVRIGVMYHGILRTILLPPTYIWEIDEQLAAAVQGALHPHGSWAARAALPLKLLAARSGLARYGRNNVVYVGGFGSYCRLAALITDLPPIHEHWEAPQLLPRCAECSRCRTACPALAISADRFLLRAEKCLTYHNERAGAFPSWIEPSWHHCIMGCMFCQRACPENRGLLGTVEVTEPFSEVETGVILEGIPKERLRSATADKLRALGILGDYELLSRNMRAVLDRGGGRGGSAG